MNKRNVYFVQPNYMFGDSAYLPFAAGAVAAYAFSDPFVSQRLKIGRFIYLREDIESAISSMEQPFFVGFSCYMWNMEYNKEFARQLRKRYPECIIALGGHQVTPGTALLDECDYIDVCMHGQGEITLHALLLSLLKGESLSGIDNISYREGGQAVSTKHSCSFRTDFPSPILSGMFDDIMSDTSRKYSTIIETSRGCPYGCSYCDWGGEKSSITQLPLERVYAEIEWAAAHKIEHLGCADSNFGIFERDIDIIRRAIEVNARTGYPKKFRVSYAKNSNDTVFEICRMLNEHGMSKGASLSFQSLSPQALECIGRKNMSTERFCELMTMYETAGIPTYSELIIGLPGETAESLREGIEQLIRAGQHTSLYVYFCELLVGSEMGSREYIERHGIEYVTVPLNLTHFKAESSDIREYSRIVVATSTMPRTEWIRANMLSLCVQCFHCFALLQYFAMYLFNETALPYTEFYARLLDWMEQNPRALCSRVFDEIREKLTDVTLSQGSLCMFDERFGDIVWPFEEAAFLKLLHDADTFFSEITPFLLSFDIEPDIFDGLLAYQKRMLKYPGDNGFSLRLSYDFHNYFLSIYKNSRTPLEKRENILSADTHKTPDTWQDFAREIVWYGRKGSNMIYKNDAEVTYI